MVNHSAVVGCERFGEFFGGRGGELSCGAVVEVVMEVVEVVVGGFKVVE